MKIEDVFIITAVSICFFVSAIFYGMTYYEIALDWESISALILGAYLYFTYLLLSMVCDKPRSLLRHF